MWICPKCKKEIDKGSAFCGYCGLKITGTPFTSKEYFKKQKDIHEKKNKKTKWIAIFVAVVLLWTFLFLFVLKPVLQKNKWEKTQSSNSIELVKKYVKENPKTIYKNEAFVLLDSLRWFKVKELHQYKYYKEFASNFPNSKFAIDAGKELKAFEWSQFRGNNQKTGFTNSNVFEEKLDLKWQFRIEDSNTNKITRVSEKLGWIKHKY